MTSDISKPDLNTDDAKVFDTLCAMQIPALVTEIVAMLSCAGLTMASGKAFNGNEVKRIGSALVAAGRAIADSQGRLSLAPALQASRFREMMVDRRLAKAWFDAWRQRSGFDTAYSLFLDQHEQLVAATRLVLFGGGTLACWQRLQQLTTHFQDWRGSALRVAVLDPFELELFERLEPSLQIELAQRLMRALSGLTEAVLKPLEDWLLNRYAQAPGLISPVLRYRLSETLLYRGEFAAARALVAKSAESTENAEVHDIDAAFLSAALLIAEGDFKDGVTRFDAALKAAAVELGRRKDLAPPGLTWLYLMALLAQSEPAAWTKARKFVATEIGKKREGDSLGLLGIWHDAIDQRLGDAAPQQGLFLREREPRLGLNSLNYLHRLLLAAWLRIPVPSPATLRQHAATLADDFTAAGMALLARLTRRAAASLLGEAASAADAPMPFFVGVAQDGWRDTLVAILALGDGDAAAAKSRERSALDRLIWAVTTRADGRIDSIEAMEQKGGVRGLGKAKAVSLATLIKRKDLTTPDAAMLRAVEREDYGNRPVLNLATAAPALVGHPGVAWARDTEQIVEVSEALPAIEIMTQGQAISFRLLDPIRSAETEKDEAADRMLPLSLVQKRLSLRNTLLLPDGPTRARLLRLTPAQLRVAELVSQGWQVPVSARAELDAALRVLAAHFQVASDAEAGHDVPPSAVLRGELTPQGAGLAMSLVAAPFGDFGPRLVPGGGRERVTTVHLGATLSTKRQLLQEREIANRLLAALDFLDDSAHDWLIADPEQALAAVEGLGQLSDVIVTEWPKGKPIRVHTVADGAVRLRASSKGDWLELDGELQLDGGELLRLRQLLDLAQVSRKRYIALGEGDFLALSDSLRQQLGDLAALAQPHKQGNRLSSVAALAWEASGNTLELSGDASWRKRSQAWARAQEMTFEVPAGLAAELRDYQVEGFRWLSRLGESGFGAVLADDMGLGKTVQTLALLLQRAAGGPALVVAPTSVCGNWLLETARFAPGLQVEFYGDGSLGDEVDGEAIEAVEAADQTAPAAGDAVDNPRRAARRRQLRALGPGQILVCSYALLQIDAELLGAVDWHSVVVDEAQAIKNPATRRARAAVALKSDFRLALTGTPIENRLGDLWAIMAFCNPGLLGSAEQFGKRFVNLIERDADDAQVKLQATRRLRRLLSPFLLRRTKAEVLTDLPPRTEIIHEVVPGSRERALLEALRQQAQDSVTQAISANADGGREGQNQFHVLAALTRLRRAACDPRLVAPELGLIGAKVHEFEQLAVELVAGRHKALVFSQFTDFLALLRERLDAAGLSYQYLDGSTPAAQRSQRVAAFQAGKGDLFLISLKAGGFGLNLTMADYVIITDPWWNPAAEEQASARAHRIGQLRPVTVYRLVTQGSIEEKIVSLHRSKRDLAEGILSGGEAAAPIDAAQLMDLLKAPG
jgi:superfamily II DNA or RNA helicase